MSASLEVSGISHRFRGLHVLRDVNLAVERHSITGLIGPNGAGKSTLFNIVSGFLTPLAGTVVYDGRPITDLTIQQRSYAGLVRTFQTPQVFADLTVFENLMAGFYKRGRTGVISAMCRLPRARRDLDEAREAAEAAVREFKLSGVRDRLAGQLPAGQQRLVELARTSVSAPRLLCLDEPSSGLNGDEVDELKDALKRMHEAGVTILLVSHDMELMNVSSIVNVLCFGEIIARGDMEAMQSDPRVREAYLGV